MKRVEWEMSVHQRDFSGFTVFFHDLIQGGMDAFAKRALKVGELHHLYRGAWIAPDMVFFGHRFYRPRRFAPLILSRFVFLGLQLLERLGNYLGVAEEIIVHDLLDRPDVLRIELASLPALLRCHGGETHCQD